MSHFVAVSRYFSFDFESLRPGGIRSQANGSILYCARLYLLVLAFLSVGKGAFSLRVEITLANKERNFPHACAGLGAYPGAPKTKQAIFYRKVSGFLRVAVTTWGNSLGRTRIDRGVDGLPGSTHPTWSETIHKVCSPCQMLLIKTVNIDIITLIL